MGLTFKKILAVLAVWIVTILTILGVGVCVQATKPQYKLMACNSITGCRNLGTLPNVATCNMFADKLQTEVTLDVIICYKGE